VFGANPSWFRPGGFGEADLPPELLENEAWLDLPVESVSWDDIQEFEARTGLALPTEAQWEYACRGGTRTPFSFGDTLNSVTQANFQSQDPLCNYARGDQYLARTTTIGSYAPNLFGLHDVHGNVWEWCEDIYDPDFYASPAATMLNPLSEEGSVARVVRGGGWFYLSWHCRSAHRFFFGPIFRLNEVGFRPVVSLASE